jgi:hypothetical protein
MTLDWVVLQDGIKIKTTARATTIECLICFAFAFAFLF